MMTRTTTTGDDDNNTHNNHNNHNHLSNCLGVPMHSGKYYLCNVVHHVLYIHRLATRQRVCPTGDTLMVSLVACTRGPDGLLSVSRNAVATWYGDDLDDLSFPWTVWGEVAAVLQKP
jgi:hypothetical protein